jgi:MFS family permease
MSPHHRYLTLAAAVMGWAIDGIEMGVFPLIARPALMELTNSDQSELIRRWNGVLAIAFLLGAALGGYLFGRLGDRIGRVKALIFSMLVYSGFTGLAALAWSPWHLASLRFLAATGMGGEWALGVALVVETWPEWARPWLAGAIGAAVNVGYIAVAILSWWIDPLQWRTILAWCAAPAALTIVVRWLVPESPVWQAAKQPATSAWKKHAFLGALAVAPYLLAVWGAVQFTQLWAQELGGDAMAGIAVQLVSAAAAIVGAVIAPLLLFSTSRRASYFFLSLLALLAAQMLFQLGQRLDPFFFMGVAGVGITSGAFGGWFALYLPELFPPAVRATGQGISYNSGRVLAAIGVALTVGPLNVRGDFGLAGVIVSSVYCVGLILAWWLPETAGRSLE